MMTQKVVILLGVVLLVVGLSLSCTGGGEVVIVQTPVTILTVTSTPVTPMPTVKPVNFSSRAACREFLFVSIDIDLLTVPEMRKKFQTVYDRTYDADPNIKRAARGIVVALTNYDFDSATTYVTQMRDACVKEGYLD